MVEDRKSKTRKQVAAEFGVPVSVVCRAETHAEWDARGREILASKPDSIAGLSWMGEIPNMLGDILIYSGDLKRVRDVVHAGRTYVAGLSGMGPTKLAELEEFLASRGMVLGEGEPPAGPQPAGSNVVKFPHRGEMAQAKLTNSYVRQRLVSLGSDWWSCWEMLQQLPNGEKTFGQYFGDVQRALIGTR